MTNRIWITRSEPAASRSAKAWVEAGYQPVVAPLLRIIPTSHAVSLSGHTELIFTSANAVRLSGLIGDDRRVYTVGDRTADVAREQGFTNVVSADGDWRKLVEAIEKTCNPILHISGAVVRGQILEQLRSRGFRVERHIVYRTEAVTDWPVDPARIDAVALYSPLAAETLMALDARDLTHLTAYCLSPNVAAPLSGLSAYIADHPSEAALIACSRPAES